MILATIAFLMINSAYSQCVSKRISYGVNQDAIRVDYAPENVKWTPQGLTLNLVKGSDGGIGCKISTVDYYQYAKITVKMTALDQPGAVTAFYTMSPRGDEIDWEFLGAARNTGESNVFYKGIEEYEIRGAKHQIGNIGNFHTYGIDWKPDSITWSADGNQLRTYKKSSELAQTKMTPPGEKSFPEERSQVQFSVWDGGSSKDPGTAKWAGGKIDWDKYSKLTATIEYIQIDCPGSSAMDQSANLKAFSGTLSSNLKDHEIASSSQMIKPFYSFLVLWLLLF